MSTKKSYSDAEKAEYWKNKALSTRQPRSARGEKYAYKQKKRVYKDEQKEKRIAAHKEPGFISKGGEMLGSMFGKPGEFLGGKIGHLIEQITGFGDYKVENNSIMKGGLSNIQIINSSNKGGFIVRHREYIGDVTATTAFTNRTYLVNPGLTTTFPWLSQVANSFELYRLRGVIFEFNSTSSDALLSSSTSTALGTVVMATEYDIADTPYSNKRDMLTAEHSCSSKPSVSFIHPIECKRSLSAQNTLFTRGNAVPEGYDPRLYDFCRFNIATEGMQANGGVLGELWIVYEIELLKQQFSYVGLSDHYKFNTISTGRPLGTVIGSNLASGGTIGGLIAGDALSYGFPKDFSNGLYQYVYTTVGISSASAIAPTVTYINAVAVNVMVNNTVSTVTPASSTNTTTVRTGTFRITGQGAFIIFATDGGPASGAVGDLWVTRLPNSII